MPNGPQRAFSMLANALGHWVGHGEVLCTLFVEHQVVVMTVISFLLVRTAVAAATMPSLTVSR
ncbi:MAG: hypothetical protein JWR21_548 [Herminiimonas sp.]|nr:hypothetical protein [Herminiimonas sp.]